MLHKSIPTISSATSKHLTKLTTNKNGFVFVKKICWCNSTVRYILVQLYRVVSRVFSFCSPKFCRKVWGWGTFKVSWDWYWPLPLVFKFASEKEDTKTKKKMLKHAQNDSLELTSIFTGLCQVTTAHLRFSSCIQKLRT